LPEDADHLGCIFDRCTGTVSEDATGHVRRRLAAILFAGYSRLFPGDEADSFTGIGLLASAIIKPQVLKSGGTFIRWTGALRDAAEPI